VSDAEPHHHLSIELNIGPSSLEDGEAVEVRVVEFVQFEYRKKREDGDQNGEALVSLYVGSELVITVGVEFLLGFNKREFAFTD